MRNLERGKYFRIVADVYVDGEDLGGLLVEAGAAVRYDGGKKTTSWCKFDNPSQLSPFLVLTSVTLLFCRLIFSHFRLSISPLLIPVDRAKVTIGNK